MSLLMQALKKAANHQRDALPDDDVLETPSETYDGVLALTTQDVLADPLPSAPDWSLEPLSYESAAGAVDAPAGSESEPPPAVQAAAPAPHDPTPPQSRRKARQVRETKREPQREPPRDRPAQPDNAATGAAMQFSQPPDAAAPPAGNAPVPGYAPGQGLPLEAEPRYAPSHELSLERDPMPAPDRVPPLEPGPTHGPGRKPSAEPDPVRTPDRALALEQDLAPPGFTELVSAHMGHRHDAAALLSMPAPVAPAIAPASGGVEAQDLMPLDPIDVEPGEDLPPLTASLAPAPLVAGTAASAGAAGLAHAGAGTASASRAAGTGTAGLAQTMPGTTPGIGMNSSSAAQSRQQTTSGTSSIGIAGTEAGQNTPRPAAGAPGIDSARRGAGPATAGASGQPSAAPPAGKSAGAAARARAAARAAAEQDRPGRDPARVRLAILGGALALVAGTLAGVYWYALTAPGPGAKLPPVPMPPPGAPAGPAPVVVAPPAAPPDSLAPPTPDIAAGAAYTPSPAYGNAPHIVPQQPHPNSGGRMPSDDDLQRALQQSSPSAPPQTPAAQLPRNEIAPNGAPAAAPQNPPATTAATDIHVSRSATPQRINPALQDGYQAFMAGDLATAAQHYASALRQDPNNRDALLGSAAVAARRNDMATAAAGYTRLLELNPSDPEAQAGMLALRPGDSGQSELRLKEMLRRDPGAGPLEFALGNLYAQQGRWPDAQQAYFRAYTAAPENADYAFNLAVGLDQLAQRKLALNYYQRALDLSRTSPAAFDRNAARRRAEQINASLPGAHATPAPAQAPAPNPAQNAAPGGASNVGPHAAPNVASSPAQAPAPAAAPAPPPATSGAAFTPPAPANPAVPGTQGILRTSNTSGTSGTQGVQGSLGAPGILGNAGAAGAQSAYGTAGATGQPPDGAPQGGASYNGRQP